MNLRLEKKHYIILLAAAVVSIFVYLIAFYLYLKPLNTNLVLKESQLKMEQELNTTLEARLATVNETDFSSTAELQKRLPVDPMVEQLVLDIEKAEVISNSFVSSIEFNAEQQAGVPLEQETTSEEQADQLNNDSADQAENAISEVPVSNSQTMVPDGLLKTSVQINVKAENYFSLEKFIETLESLRRIVVVESISFSGPQESFAVSDEEVPIEMSLSINSFYFPELSDLMDYNPKIQAPEPANKRNPFPTFGDYSEDNLIEQEQSEGDETEETGEN
jgi:type IV pilus assembly protein PilO